MELKVIGDSGLHEGSGGVAEGSRRQEDQDAVHPPGRDDGAEPKALQDQLQGGRTTHQAKQTQRNGTSFLQEQEQSEANRVAVQVQECVQATREANQETQDGQHQNDRRVQSTQERTKETQQPQEDDQGKHQRNHGRRLRGNHDPQRGRRTPQKESEELKLEEYAQEYVHHQSRQSQPPQPQSRRIQHATPNEEESIHQCPKQNHSHQFSQQTITKQPHAEVPRQDSRRVRTQ